MPSAKLSGILPRDNALFGRKHKMKRGYSAPRPTSHLDVAVNGYPIQVR